MWSLNRKLARILRNWRNESTIPELSAERIGTSNIRPIEKYWNNSFYSLFLSTKFYIFDAHRINTIVNTNGILLRSAMWKNLNHESFYSIWPKCCQFVIGWKCIYLKNNYLQQPVTNSSNLYKTLNFFIIDLVWK